jgi:peptidoglycan/xylan/chitin deacetylase (PgdA/CDA1 family)
MIPLLTIITYHYVRPIKTSRWPNIKGLELKEFCGQLDYIQRYYNSVSLDMILASARGEKVDWPRNPILLTFDDGYADHHDHVFPELHRRNIQGCFFASARPLLDREILDVNKVHFVLACSDNHINLAATLDTAVSTYDDQSVVPRIPNLRELFFKPSRWDPAETVYVKRVLQRGLPPKIRSAIVDQMFRSVVSVDPVDFAEQLYMTTNQARQMIDEGMSFGCHGNDHIWLGQSTEAEQRHDITRSMRLSSALGISPENTSFCYPYGSYNTTTLDIIKSFKCTVAFTTRLDLNAIPPVGNMLELARIDAGADLPRNGNAPISRWTEQILSQKFGPRLL